jgi:hypothetical protein
VKGDGGKAVDRVERNVVLVLQRRVGKDWWDSLAVYSEGQNRECAKTKTGLEDLYGKDNVRRIRRETVITETIEEND